MKPLLLLLCGTLLFAGMTPINAQTFKWGQALGSHSTAACVAADHEHNMVLAGSYQGTIHTGTDSFVTVNSKNGYVIKYDSSGDEVWANNIIAKGDIEITAVTVDANNNIYVCGNFIGSDSVVYFTATDSIVLSDGGGSCIAKYDAQGNFVWATHADGIVIGQTISTDKAGNVIWGGNYFYFASFSGVDMPLDSSFIDLFIAKYTPSGSLVWAKKGKTLDSVGKGSLSQVATDSNGSIYCTGYVSGDVVFGADTMTNTDNAFYVYVAKFDTIGNLLWYVPERQMSVLNIFYLKPSVAVDSKGNVYSGGGVQDSGANNLSPFIAKYNSTGTLRWFKEYTGTTRYGIDGIVVDGKDNPYFTGDYTGQIQLDTATLYNVGFGGMIAKLDTAGSIMWVQSTHGPDYLNSLSMAMDERTGNIAIAGIIKYGLDTLGTVTFPQTTNSGYIAYITNPVGLSVSTVPHAIQCVIYPNPATSELYIRNATAGSAVNIYNVNGQAVYMGQLSGTQGNIHIQNLSKGIYFVKMMAPDGAVQIKTFVKE